MKLRDLIRELRQKHSMTQADLAKRLNVAPTAVSAWEGGKNRPLIDKIILMSEIFNTPLSDFFDDIFTTEEKNSDLALLPIVGKISCGNGVFAFEEISGYEPTPNEWLNGGEYFYLQAKGDSMINARIVDGDLLLMRKQEDVDDGEIAAVFIEDETYLKRVFKRNDTLILQSENPKYPPIICDPKKENCRIIGKLKKIIIKM